MATNCKPECDFLNSEIIKNDLKSDRIKFNILSKAIHK